VFVARPAGATADGVRGEVNMNIFKWFQYVFYIILRRHNDPDPIGSFQEWLDYLNYVEWCENDYYDENHAWLCQCGHFEESGLHCSRCGEEPPWGCDCGLCDERQYENSLDELEWLDAWEAYPGELLVGSDEFEGQAA
jgi:hypothetical protein